MKTIKSVVCGVLAVAFITACAAGFAAEEKKTAKPYPIKTCLVSEGKLGDMGDPYVFTYQGREIKLCCKGCLKTFDKDPAKYIKKLEEAEKQAK
jgi:hypothetical protein